MGIAQDGPTVMDTKKTGQPHDGKGHAIQVLNIGATEDVLAGGVSSPIVDSLAVRIVAIEDSRIKIVPEDDQDAPGTLLPAGTVEYFTIYEGWVVSCIEGNINVTSTSYVA